MRRTENFDIRGGQLNLWWCQIGDEGMEQICTLDTLTIRSMKLSYNNISAIGIAAISQARWNNLENLWLNFNKIGNLGCKYLSRGHFTSLKQITLMDIEVGNAGIMHLSKVQWTNMTTIWLGYNPLSIDGIKQLVSAKWDNLQFISLYQCDLTFTDLLYLLLLSSKPTKLFLRDNLPVLQEQVKVEDCMKLKIPNCEFKTYQ